jgi:hypothetical protein
MQIENISLWFCFLSKIVRVACLCVLLLLPSVLLAQQPDETDLQEVIENVARGEDSEEFQYDGSIDDLENLRKRQVNLNRATREDLSEIVLLSTQQIQALLQYREKHGNFISIYEVQAVPYWDVATIKSVLPFVKVNTDISEAYTSIKDLFSKGVYQFISRYQQVIEKSNGYTVPADTAKQYYQGSPFRLFARFRYSYGTKMSYGITVDKDAGEEFFKGSNKRGFDFYSGHFYIRDVKALKALALGDFEVRLGQGVIMWTGFGFRKSPSVMSVKREGLKLRPYTSVNEMNFLRGGGFTVGAKGFEVTAFASYKMIDANVVSAVATDTTIDEEEYFSSLLATGYHRTQNEIKGRERVAQLIAGGNFSYNKRNWHIGANAVYTRYFSNYQRNLQTYSAFDFSSNQLLNVSVDYHAAFRNIHLFGENAISQNGGFGLLNGMLVSLDRRVDLSVVHRYYSKEFQTVYGNAFAESSRPQNEHGVYLGLTVRPIKYLQLDAFADLYMHPWMKYLIDAPSWGNENFLQATIKPNRRSEIYVRYRFETKKRNSPLNDLPLDYTVNQTRQGVRYQHRFRVTDEITIGNRVELSFYNLEGNKPETGFVIYQDIGFKKLGFPLSADARFAVFRTPSYNTRIYAYENDVLYSFSIPAYYGNGIRYYLTLRYSATRWLDFWVRWAQTYRSDVKVFGSGLDEINGNKKSEIKVQMRVRF